MATNASTDAFQVDAAREKELKNRYLRRYSSELMFAVDVVQLVMHENTLPFVPFFFSSCLGVPPKSPFDRDMEDAIRFLLPTVKFSAQEQFNNDLNTSKPTYEDFKKSAMFSVQELSKQGYDDCGFLMYCSRIAEFAAIAYSSGVVNAPEFAVVTICHALQTYEKPTTFPGSGWESLAQTARELKRSTLK